MGSASNGVGAIFGNIALILLIIGAIVGILWLIYYLLRDRLIGKITYERSFDESGVFEGETCVFTETVTNTGFLPLFGVRVESYFYKDIELDGVPVPSNEIMQYSESRFNLLPFMQIKRKHTVRCLKRGFFVFETANVIFFKKERFFTAPTEIYVYPRIVNSDLNQLAFSSLQGDYSTSKRLIPDPFNMSGIRDYLPGDSFNMINFKATARSAGTIKVNNYDYSSSRTILVYLNFQMNPEMAAGGRAFDSMMEDGLAFAAAITREALENGNRVGFGANCQIVTGEKSIFFAPANSRIHLLDILREMAMARTSEGISFCSMLDKCIGESVTDTEIYIISTFESTEIAERADRLRKQGNFVRFILLEKGDRSDEE